MPSKINTILFDAIGTLWHPARPITEMWMDVLLRFDVVRTPQEIFLAATEHLHWQAPQFLAFETSGQPVDDETIEAVWLEFDKRVLQSLGINASTDDIVREVYPIFEDFNALYENTVDVLASIQDMGYRMVMVSNGVYQRKAVAKLKILNLFDSIIGSFHVGFMKPDPKIFNLALREMGASTEQALMVGDTWDADVLGARSLGIHVLHLRREEAVDVSKDEISSLHGVVDYLVQYQEK